MKICYMLQRYYLNKACIVYPNYEINYIINVRLSLWYSKVRNRKLGTFDICPPYSSGFYLRIEKREKICENVQK